MKEKISAASVHALGSGWLDQRVGLGHIMCHPSNLLCCCRQLAHFHEAELYNTSGLMLFLCASTQKCISISYCNPIWAFSILFDVCSYSGYDDCIRQIVNNSDMFVLVLTTVMFYNVYYVYFCYCNVCELEIFRRYSVLNLRQYNYVWREGQFKHSLTWCFRYLMSFLVFLKPWTVALREWSM